MRGVGWLLPILNTRYGAALVAGSGLAGSNAGLGAAVLSATRITPSTMSCTKVKSRTILPWLKMLIGSPARMALVNKNSAMSGLPQGP